MKSASYLPALLLLFAVTAAAQDRSLYWKSLDVEARLDRDGALHIREMQHYVFNGDWNGGERTFRLAPGQRRNLARITRIDPESGAEFPLAPGDLSAVDQYGWTDSSTLRWRSRRPDDPPFAATEIIYLLEYEIRPAVRQSGAGYEIDHDFAFADRAGVIERFSLQLEIDSPWRVAGKTRTSYSATNLVPGEGFDVDVPLEFTEPGFPAAVARPPGSLTQAIVLAVLVIPPVIFILAFLRLEKTTSRFDPLTPPEEIDDAWLEKHVFTMPPEVAGAAWDNRTDASEVAALLARLVQEKKIRSRIEPSGWGPFKSEVLHLSLETDRANFSEYERPLINKLFYGKRTKVDTKTLRKKYQGTGFNPASVIEKGIGKKVKKLTPSERQKRSTPWLPVWWLLAGGAILLVAAVVLSSKNLGIAVIFSVIGFVLLAFSAGQAGAFAKMVGPRILPAVFMMLPVAIFGILIGIVAVGLAGPSGLIPLMSGYYYPSMLVLLGLATLSCAFVAITLRVAISNESAEKIELRRQLTAARNFFSRELGKPEPRLKDSWYPWLIAFGLGSSVDRWFRSFGSESMGVLATGSRSSGSSGSSGTSGWTGGGGSFGGAGASGAWAAAAGSVASSYSSPSSGGSGGGGGGGGSSSGGGGGGGW